MATVSKTDLIGRAARRLRVVQVGQGLTTEDQQTLDEAHASVLSSLRRAKVAYWSDDDCPTWAARDVARLMAADVVEEYYSDAGVQQSYANLAARALASLQEHVARQETSDKTVHTGFY